MWLMLGILSIICTFVNICMCIVKKENKYFMICALSFTSLTICSFYSKISEWILKEDWSAIIDVHPTMGKVLWILTILSIILNVFIPIFLEYKKSRT